MTILHLASEYPPQQVYGLGRFVRDLAEEQARQGHEVIILTNSMGGLHYDTVQNGVRVCRIPFPSPPKPKSIIDQVLIFNILLIHRAVLLGFDKISNTDVVCSHDWLTVLSANAIHTFFGIPHFCTIHDTHIGKRLGKIRNTDDASTIAIEQFGAECATHVIANSDATRAELEAVYGVGREKISVVPCAIAPHTFNTTEDRVRLDAFRETFALKHELIVLYVGRLDPEKGVEALIEAFATCTTQQAKLLIAGNGTLNEQLQLLAKKLGLGDRVEFLGYVENPILAHLYRVSDIFVCPSYYEPFGMVVLEAMLQGTPVIATETGGLAVLVENGRTGLLVKPGNREQLTESIETLLSNPELRSQFGKAGSKRVMEKYTWKNVCKETTKVYENKKKRVDAIPQVEVSKLDFEAIDANTGAARLLPEQIGLSSIREAFYHTASTLLYTKNIPKEVRVSHWKHILAARVFQNAHTQLSWGRWPTPRGNDEFDNIMWEWAELHGSDTQRARVERPAAAGISCIAAEKVVRNALGRHDGTLVAVLFNPNSPHSYPVVLRAVRNAQMQSKNINWILFLNEIPESQVDFEGVLQKSRILEAGESPITREAFLKSVDLIAILDRVSAETLVILEQTNARVVCDWPVADQLRHHAIRYEMAHTSELLALVSALTEDSSASFQNKITLKDLVLFNNWGLGDEIMVSAVARELRQRYPELNVWIKSRFGFKYPEYCETRSIPRGAKVVETIYQNAVLCGPQYHSPFPGHLVQQMLDKIALDTGLTVKAKSHTPSVLVERIHNDNKKRIVLHSRPNKRLPSKDWGLERWMQLANILRDRGYTVIQVGDSDEALLPGVVDMRGIPPSEVPEITATCGLVICLVGFLMHVAAAVETPAIVIYGGREHPSIDGYTGQLHISSDPLDCRGRWGCHLAPDTACTFNMRCMEKITPAAIAGLAEIFVQDGLRKGL